MKYFSKAIFVNLFFALLCVMGDMHKALAANNHEGGGMPQLNSESFPSQVFWLFVTFGVFYIIISRFVAPQLAQIKDERNVCIRDDQAEAQSLKSAAEEALAAYTESLEEARKIARQIIDQTQTDIAQNAEQEKQELNLRLTQMTNQAHEDLISQKQDTLEHLQEISHDVTLRVIEALIGKKPTEKTVEKAVKHTIKEAISHASNT